MSATPILTFPRFLLSTALCFSAVGVFARPPAGGTPASFATEDATAGWALPPEPLARALVTADADDRRLVDEEIRERGLARNDRQFLRIRPVRLATRGHPALFVRPANEPYYMPFYGAHIFRFWFVDASGKVLFAAAADAVAVLPSIHAGMHDLRVSQCRAGACYETTEVWEQGRYRDGACTTSSADGVHPGCP